MPPTAPGDYVTSGRSSLANLALTGGQTGAMVGPKLKTGGQQAQLWVDMSKVHVADSRLELCQLSRLLQLIRRRDFDAIANLVDKGVPSIVDYVHPATTDPLTLGAGQTALGLAADANDEVMLDFLLGRTIGANPSVYDLKGRSAAMRAAESGNVQSMRTLAEAGTDMKIVDEAGQGCYIGSICDLQRTFFLPAARLARKKKQKF